MQILATVEKDGKEETVCIVGFINSASDRTFAVFVDEDRKLHDLPISEFKDVRFAR